MAQLIHPIMANGAITNGTAESARLEYFAMGLQPTTGRSEAHRGERLKGLGWLTGNDLVSLG